MDKLKFSPGAEYTEKILSFSLPGDGGKRKPICPQKARKMNVNDISALLNDDDILVHSLQIENFIMFINQEFYAF